MNKISRNLFHLIPQLSDRNSLYKSTNQRLFVESRHCSPIRSPYYENFTLVYHQKMSLSGLILLSLQPILISAGAFFMDYNETHVFNPTWPGHARFHNGQTMSMSMVLCLLTLYYAWRSPYLATIQTKRDSLLTAALIGSVYTFTGLTAQLYPGTLCVDKMFWEYGADPGCPQNFIFGIPLVVNWLGYLVTSWQLGPENGSVTKKVN
jgi:hypothetical protein